VGFRHHDGLLVGVQLVDRGTVRLSLRDADGGPHELVLERVSQLVPWPEAVDGADIITVCGAVGLET
jgi:hypothetical protein